MFAVCYSELIRQVNGEGFPEESVQKKIIKK